MKDTESKSEPAINLSKNLAEYKTIMTCQFEFTINCVSACSPSRGGYVTVYVLDMS